MKSYSKEFLFSWSVVLFLFFSVALNLVVVFRAGKIVGVFVYVVILGTTNKKNVAIGNAEQHCERENGRIV